MKNIVFLLLLMTPAWVFSQEKVTHTDGILTLSYTNSNGDVISEQNLAKNVTVAYDTFYKSYYIEGDLVDRPFNTTLKYVQTISGVEIYSDGGQNYMVFDNLKDNKGFMFTNQKTEEPNRTYFITGLKRYYPR